MNKRRRWKAKARRLDAYYRQRWMSLSAPRAIVRLTITIGRLLPENVTAVILR